MASVVTEGRPEEWLGRVEAAMFAATKRALVRGLEDSKGVQRRGHPLTCTRWVGSAAHGSTEFARCPPSVSSRLHAHHSGTKKEKWVRAHPGQVVLTAGQILWTAECERALADTEQGPRRALKALRKRWLAYLNELTGMTRSKLEPVDRSKVGTRACACGVGLVEGVLMPHSWRHVIQAQPFAMGSSAMPQQMHSAAH